MGRVNSVAKPFRQADIPAEPAQDKRQGQQGIRFHPHQGAERLGNRRRQIRHAERPAEEPGGNAVSRAPVQEERDHDRGDAGAASAHGIKQDHEYDSAPAVVCFQHGGEQDGGSRRPYKAQEFLFPDAPQGSQSQEKRQENVGIPVYF